MIFEDLHWIDPTSREVLDLTVETITGLLGESGVVNRFEALRSGITASHQWDRSLTKY